MKEKIDLLCAEVEGLNLVELGDATEETRQINPWPAYIDNVFGFGEYA